MPSVIVCGLLSFFERGIIDAATVLKIREDPLAYRGHANYS